MRKLTALILAAVMVMTVLCGCNILEMGTPPTLPRLHYDDSALTGKVEFVNGRTCRISILEGDGLVHVRHQEGVGQGGITV